MSAIPVSVLTTTANALAVTVVESWADSEHLTPRQAYALRWRSTGWATNFPG